MRILLGSELDATNKWFEMVRQEAIKSPCKRARCGTVIARMYGDEIALGWGWNQPAGGVNPRCENLALRSGFKSDKTCCIHAEQVAIMHALSRGREYDSHYARLYFARVDDDGQLKPSGQPYCTICSKMALHAGIKEWCLIHKAGVTVYDATEYNELSYDYGDPVTTGPMGAYNG
jgi:deoxycytidylate deaminase